MDGLYGDAMDGLCGDAMDGGCTSVTVTSGETVERRDG
jgi:hypothetical protein